MDLEVMGQGKHVLMKREETEGNEDIDLEGEEILRQMNLDSEVHSPTNASVTNKAT